MLSKDGFLELDEVEAVPGFPGLDVLARKKCVVIECAQNIPCNPCEVSCPQHAITVGEPITNLPVVDESKCVACGLCVASCPGQAIFLVDQTAEDYDTVTLPYEYYPLPEKDQEVYCLSRSGQFLTKGHVLRIVLTKKNDRTAVVEVKVPKGYGMQVRNISTDGKRMASDKPAERPDAALLESIDEDQMYVCRCEEITKGEIRRAVHDGMFTLTEIRRYLRTGMGLCQGQTCTKLVKGIVARELGVRPNELGPATGRAPMRPIEMTVLARDKEETK